MAMLFSQKSGLAKSVAHTGPNCTRKTLTVCMAVQQPRQSSMSVLARLPSILASGLISASLLISSCEPAAAGLNEFEYEAPSEFGKGSAGQFGEANIDGQDFTGQDLRRSNFTGASAKKAKFNGANLQGAYFMKSVVFKADFTDANLSDTLMDRAVINEAILRNANLSRAVLTRSDLTKADIYGADFTNALLDKTQQIALCRYADGVNSVTGESTRKSLGCGSGRRFRGSSPSNPDGPQVSAGDQDAFRKTMPDYRMPIE